MRPLRWSFWWRICPSYGTQWVNIRRWVKLFPFYAVGVPRNHICWANWLCTGIMLWFWPFVQQRAYVCGKMHEEVCMLQVCSLTLLMLFWNLPTGVALTFCVHRFGRGGFGVGPDSHFLFFTLQIWTSGIKAGSDHIHSTSCSLYLRYSCSWLFAIGVPMGIEDTIDTASWKQSSCCSFSSCTTIAFLFSRTVSTSGDQLQYDRQVASNWWTTQVSHGRILFSFSFLLFFILFVN